MPQGFGGRKRGGGRSSGPTRSSVSVRRSAVRIDRDTARWIRQGHPWIFRDSLRSSAKGLEGKTGLVEIVDRSGDFVGRGYFVKEGAIALRVLSVTPRPSSVRGIVGGAVDRALARRRLLPVDLTAYRLIHGDGEGLSGIVVDRYSDHAVMYLYCEEAEFLVAPVCEDLGRKAGLSGIYLQRRYRPASPDDQREAARLVWGVKADVEQVVYEDGLKFWVDVRAPLSAGLFADLREARALVRRLAKGARVLNLFSHTGAFSVAAAAGGAARVVSVDLSRRYQAVAQKNFRLNQLDLRPHEFVAADVSGYLAQVASRRSERFDLVVVDPPTFSAGRRKAFALSRDYPDLIRAILSVLTPGGLILAASNTRKMPESDFHRLLAEGGAMAGRPLVVLGRFGLPLDFPVPTPLFDGHYLKAVLCQAD